MLHILSNELIAERPQNEIPEHATGGFQDDVYDRYISYEQATLGLGKLTNEFPLPPSYTMTTSNDDNYFTDPSIKIYPNPATDEITIEGVEPDLVEIYGMDGRKLLTEEKTKQIKVIDLSCGMFIIKIGKGNRTWTSKLFIYDN